MKPVKTILISQFALPYDGIGSWTTMYNYYLLKQNHLIDIIIAPPATKKLKNVSYYNVSYSTVDKIKRKIIGNGYFKYLEILKKIIKPNERYLIQIIDNHGLVLPLHQFLLKKNWRENCYLQFFYHGYPPFLVNFIGNAFYEALNEHVVLTYDSYIAHQQHYTVLPCAFSVLHNGIDTTQFYPVSATVKANLRSQFNVANQTLVFIWCSQDRPKKGLDFILNVWKLLTPQYPTIELWVIGTTRTINQPQVKVFGRIPNNELPKFYQAADFYLFPSLCHEGFGLSLVEAFKCGCYCIASKNGGIPEVLNYGAYGTLVEHPNIINNWVQTIKSSITAYENAHKTHQFLQNAPTEIYSIEQWSTGMNTIISNAKVLLK